MKSTLKTTSGMELAEKGVSELKAETAVAVDFVGAGVKVSKKKTDEEASRFVTPTCQRRRPATSFAASHYTGNIVAARNPWEAEVPTCHRKTHTGGQPFLATLSAGATATEVHPAYTEVPNDVGYPSQAFHHAEGTLDCATAAVAVTDRTRGESSIDLPVCLCPPRYTERRLQGHG
ncbi:tyrosine-protein phosphatase non-receptor type 23 [Lasius niger]|uniref:Tyrosine-protein phosphatase non-receptor type 23 n=1 Tax=Lasius niger TaxID=67767 RepID=A0A0J7KMD7_LASNI|nr:tyrosine-protein phosphatase non-receptor type 23 [Lasius niger]